VRIRSRIIFGFLIVVITGFYFLVDWIADDIRPKYLQSMEESLVDTATILSAILSKTLQDKQIDTQVLREVFDDVYKQNLSIKIYKLTKKDVDLRVYVTDKKGIVLFDSNDGKDEGKDYSRWNDVLLTLRGKYGARATREDSDDPDTSILYIASPIKSDDEIIGVLTVCKPLKYANLFISSGRQRIIMGGTLICLAVSILGFIAASWLARPIQRLTDFARAVRDGKSVALPELGGSEIATMGRAFEEMRDALEGKKYVEQYVETMTHEIKGPISAIKGASELLEEDMPAEQRTIFLTNIRNETNRIQHIIDRLLQLSEIEGRKGLLKIEEINISKMLAEICDSFQPILVKRRITLTSDSKKNGSIRGEYFLISQAIHNLLQNSVEFTPEGGSIAVYTETKADAVEVVIKDDGPGVPEYAINKVFDRFYSLPRPDTGNKSSGLGLSLVLEVTKLHGGTIKLENHTGGGAKATLQLPCVPAV